MTLEELFQETQQNLVDLASISDKVAKARSEIAATQEVTSPAEAHARMAEAMQSHQTLYLGVISRQLLWLQRAFLEQWREGVPGPTYNSSASQTGPANGDGS